MSVIADSPIVAAPVADQSVPPTMPMKNRSRHRWVKWTLLGGLAALLILITVIWRGAERNGVSFETVAVERGPIQSFVTTTGTLNAVVDVQVGSQISGNIKALYADYNTKVKKGQLIALIDPEMFQAQVRQTDATVGGARMAVVSAEAQVHKAAADVSAAIASQKNAEALAAKDQANAVNASNQYQREAALFKEGIVSQQDYDSAKATYDAATAQVRADQAQVDGAKDNVRSAQAQFRVAQTQLSSAQAQQSQAQAALDQARINLAHTRITAPVDGTVISRNMSVGQTIAASFQVAPIFDIAQDLTKMQVDTNVDESDVGSLQVGQKATFTVDAYSGMRFRGEVVDVRKAPITQQNVVTYDAVITVANPDLKLFPGMTANVTILTHRVENTLKIPNAVLRLHPSAEVLSQLAVPPAQASTQVLYVPEGSKVEAVPVTLGISDGKYTAITGRDLREGQRVIVRFVTRAASGMPAAPGMPHGPRF
jgi:HlyD family secretion protein